MDSKKDSKLNADGGKMFESNLRNQLTSFFKTFFINHENASVTALISFKLNDNSDDYFVKINFSPSDSKTLLNINNNQSTLRIQTSPMESEIVSESSVKENSKPKSSSKSFGSEFEDKEAEFSDEYNNILKFKNIKNENEVEFKNIFLSNNNEIKTVSKSDRRKSKRPQRKVFENTNEVNEFGTKVKSLKLLGNISLFNSSNIKTEEVDIHEMNNEDNVKEKFEKESSNSIIISNDHKILPSILALNGISNDNSILTSALMSPSNGLTILSQNAYNILRSVGSLTVAAQSNSIPFLNTCVSLSNTNTTQSNLTNNKNKGLLISSSNIASISMNQQISQAPTLAVISADNNVATSTSQNSLRAISTITTSRQSVPSQVVQAHSSKLYKCRYCCKTFNRKFCRERHERLHTGIKPYTCEICNDKFIRLEDKKRHVRSTHSGRDSSTDLNNGTYLSRSNSPEIPSTKI